MTALPSPSVTVRGPRGAQVCGPVVSRAILVGLVAAQRAALQPGNVEAGGRGDPPAGGAGAPEVGLGQPVAVPGRPGDHGILLRVMGDKADALACGHDGHGRGSFNRGND